MGLISDAIDLLKSPPEDLLDEEEKTTGYRILSCYIDEETTPVPEHAFVRQWWIIQEPVDVSNFHDQMMENLRFIIACHLKAQQEQQAYRRIHRDFRLNTNLTSRERDETLPDLAVYEQPLMEDLGSIPTGTVPLLIIEILSDSTKTKDQTTKKQKYLQLGVPYYWIITKGENAQEGMQGSIFYKLEEDQYVDQSRQFQEKEQLSCPLLADLVINADDVWNKDPAQQFDEERRQKEEQKIRADKLEKELAVLKKKLAK
jgi:Uma2 family endonuclease